MTATIGGRAYWAARAAAAHFLALVGKAYFLPAHFLMFKNVQKVIILLFVVCSSRASVPLLQHSCQPTAEET